MPEILMVRKGILPIAKMRVEVAGQVFAIAGRKSQQIDLPEGELAVKLGLEGWYATNIVAVTAASSRLIIKPFIPDLLYALGVLSTAAFFYFDSAPKWVTLLLGITGALTILTIFYFTFLRSQKYFSCTVE